jgi:hypothetical protein
MKAIIPFIVLLVIFAAGCHSKKTDLGEIVVRSIPLKKQHYKTHDQFIQIAYIDLFNKTIEPQRLERVKQLFDSQGDDDINYDLFIKELIKEASPGLPPDAVMKGDPGKFADQSYLKFFGRHPSGYEKKILVDEINNNKSVSVSRIYYILMTTEEYRMF